MFKTHLTSPQRSQYRDLHCVCKNRRGNGGKTVLIVKKILPYLAASPYFLMSSVYNIFSPFTFSPPSWLCLWNSTVMAQNSWLPVHATHFPLYFKAWKLRSPCRGVNTFPGILHSDTRCHIMLKRQLYLFLIWLLWQPRGGFFHVFLHMQRK